LATAIRWFHGPIPVVELLPARAVSYVVALFNTNLARGALAGYLARRLNQPVLQLGSTVIFLVLTEYTHLVSWATLGLVLAGPETRRELLWVLPAVAGTWLVFLAYTRFNVRPADLLRLARRGDARSPRAGGMREWALLRTFRVAPVRRYAQIVLLRAPMFFLSLCLHFFAAPTFGIHIPFLEMLAFLPIIFMIAALPITVAHLGTTQAAWIFFFSAYAPPERLLVFSLAAHATFTATRAMLGLLFTPKAYADLVHPPRVAV
nr:flippase-like domain-containing protein [Acidobacteriota bacterium]